MVDDAYLARRIMAAVGERLGRQRTPAEETADRQLRDVIIGEPFASQLDWIALQTLGGPQVAQALRALASASAQAAWTAAMNERAVDTAVRLRMGVLGIV